MFNRVFYSPARSPCSRAALRMIAAALCASGCGWRSAATPKGPSSAVRAAVLRAFVTEVFAPSLLLPASRQSGRLPPRGNSTAYVLPCGVSADDSRNRLHGGTATPPATCGYGKKKNRCPLGRGRVTAVRRANWLGKQDLDLK